MDEIKEEILEIKEMLQVLLNKEQSVKYSAKRMCKNHSPLVYSDLNNPSDQRLHIPKEAQEMFVWEDENHICTPECYLGPDGHNWRPIALPYSYI